MQSTPSMRRNVSAMVAVAIGLVVLADWLFYRQPIGWSLAIFAFCLCVAVLGRHRRILGDAPGRIVGLGMVGLIGALIYQPTPIALSMAIVALMTLTLIQRNGWSPDVVEWLHRWLRFALQGWTQAIHDNYLYARWQKSRDTSSATHVRFIAAWIIPLALGSVFVALFGMANPVISIWLTVARDWLTTAADRFPHYFAPWRVALWFGVGLWAWAFLRYRTKSRRAHAKQSDAEALLVPGAPLAVERLRDPAMLVRCLAVFNVVFVVQTTLDLYYLCGGGELPQGMTYAAYAHRGAYPLIATALLAAGFVLVTFRSGTKPRALRHARRLVYLWIAQNLFLVGTACWRLGLYVSVYSLSRWRVAAALWMVLVAAGLVWIVLRIMANRDNAWLLRGNFVTAALMLYLCSFVNFDGHIAMYNVTHSKEMGGHAQVSIDLAYLESLGTDALPALALVSDQTDNGLLAAKARVAMAQLEAQLHKDVANWRAWTVRRFELTMKFPNDRQGGLRLGRIHEQPRSSFSGYEPGA